MSHTDILTVMTGIVIKFTRHLNDDRINIYGNYEDMITITRWLNENIGSQGKEWDCMNTGEEVDGHRRNILLVFKEEEHAVAFKLKFL